MSTDKRSYFIGLFLISSAIALNTPLAVVSVDSVDVTFIGPKPARSLLECLAMCQADLACDVVAFEQSSSNCLQVDPTSIAGPGSGSLRVYSCFFSTNGNTKLTSTTNGFFYPHLILIMLLMEISP